VPGTVAETLPPVDPLEEPAVPGALTTARSWPPVPGTVAETLPPVDPLDELAVPGVLTTARSWPPVPGTVAETLPPVDPLDEPAVPGVLTTARSWPPVPGGWLAAVETLPPLTDPLDKPAVPGVLTAVGPCPPGTEGWSPVVEPPPWALPPTDGLGGTEVEVLVPEAPWPPDDEEPPAFIKNVTNTATCGFGVMLTNEAFEANVLLACPPAPLPPNVATPFTGRLLLELLLVDVLTGTLVVPALTVVVLPECDP
jgi:hypothetical protein